MPALLRITHPRGVLDLSSYLRLAEGDGLDPGSAKISGEFGESVAGEGAPLISLSIDNREQVFPVHLNAATKPALNDLVIDVNLALQAATLIEWRDDGATGISYLEPELAWFEPEFRFFRGRACWQSGTVHIAARPFAHTGTNINRAPGVGQAPFAIALGAVEGDAQAQLQVAISMPSQAATAFGDRRVVGYAVTPSGHRAWWPAASLNAFGVVTASLAGVSQAAGSQALTRAVAGSYTSVAAVLLPDGAPYAGRQRVLALARITATGADPGVDLQAVDFDEGYNATGFIGTHDVTTCEHDPGWRVLDCGVSDIDPALRPQPVILLNARDRAGAAPAKVEIAGMLILPEDGTALAVDDLALDAPTYVFSEPEGRTVRYGIAAGMTRVSLDPARRGAFPGATPGPGGDQVWAFALPDGGGARHNHTVSASVKVRERFRYARP